jgi:hypothetical protein
MRPHVRNLSDHFHAGQILKIQIDQGRAVRRTGVLALTGNYSTAYAVFAFPALALPLGEIFQAGLQDAGGIGLTVPEPGPL